MVEAIQPSTWRYIRSARVARDYDRYFADNPLFRYDTALLERWFDRPGRLLDLGCGTGRHVVHFARRGFTVVGVDLSGPMLSIAADKLKRASLSARLLQEDVLNIHRHLPAGSFDYVICMFSTFGLVAGRRNRYRLLRRIHRLLKPAGRLALHVHNRRRNLFSFEGQAYLVRNAFSVLAGRDEWGDKYLGRYRGIRRMYVHVFSLGEITRLLERSGLRLLETVNLNRARNGPLRIRLAASWRANGFILLAARPEPAASEHLPSEQAPRTDDVLARTECVS